MKTLTVYAVALLFLLFGTLSAQNTQISGKVTSDKGNSISGVSVIVKGTALGTYTKPDGTFKLSVPKSATTLLFRALGWKTIEVELAGKTEFNVKMEEDVILKDEVVVTAIGVERDKKSIGYSVEEVGGKAISEARAVNVVNAITGKVAGVQINNSTGTPGASSYIRIRGATSITGENQPLFVIDGIPIDNSMSYSGNPDNGRNNLLDGVAYSNRAVDINPDDVESMTVLKGPAATALYGIRASNGAIVITTKKGTAYVGEKMNVSFTTTLGFDEVNKLPEMQSKYAQGVSGGYRGTGEATMRNYPLSWGPEISTLRFDGATTNMWYKDGNIVTADQAPAGAKAVPAYDNLNNFFQTGRDFTNSLSMAGGTEYGSFFLSVSNSSINGIVPRSTFDRSTVRFNGEARISSRVRASGSINYTNSGGTRIQQGSNTSGVMLGLLRTTPTFDNSAGFGADGYDHTEAYMFADGRQRSYRGYGGYDNPLWTVNRNQFKDNVDRFIGYAQLNYFVADWLDITYRLGSDIYTDKRFQKFGIYSAAVPAGRVFDHTISSSDINSDLLFNFNYKFTEDLFSKLILGMNHYSSHGKSVYIQGDGLIVSDFYHLSNTQGQFSRESDDKLRRFALFGDLTLDYLEMLYFNGTMRYEMSTTLPEKNNAFMYGSGNLSFVFTNAFKDIFKESPISFGKIRANYAVVGKDAPLYSIYTPFIQGSYADGWVDGISFPYGGYVGFVKGDILGNEELKPESTSSWEFGLNVNLWDGLFDIDFTYYSSYGKDQIFAVPIATSSGYWRQIMNAGEISNKGFELVITSNLYKDEDWKIDLGWNFSKNENMVEKLAEGVDNIFLGGFEGSSIRAVAGKPYGTIFGYGWLRHNGQVVIDGDPESPDYGFPILDPMEKDFGSANPDWLMGLRGSVSWKGLTLSFLFDIKSGGVIWNGTKGAMYYFGTHKDTEIRGSKKVFDGVIVDANGNATPNNIEVTVDENWLAFNNGNGFYGNNTEDFIEDAGWVRLRELSLSYQLPSSIIEYTPFSDVIVTFTGRNLWLSTDYTGVDPETSLMGAHNAQGIDYFNMPSTKSYIFSLNFKF